MKSEYQTIAICSTRTRPNRSDSEPAIQPPNDEVSNATVPIVPAVPAEMPHSAITVGTT
ncbi:MAG TPA: hypothetical protein VFQ90_07965 [Stellaceae bacterium]|nr:hypothetical protein [Stellaceae bacterium]